RLGRLRTAATAGDAVSRRGQRQTRLRRVRSGTRSVDIRESGLADAVVHHRMDRHGRGEPEYRTTTTATGDHPAECAREPWPRCGRRPRGHRPRCGTRLVRPSATLNRPLRNTRTVRDVHPNRDTSEVRVTDTATSG